MGATLNRAVRIHTNKQSNNVSYHRQLHGCVCKSEGLFSWLRLTYLSLTVLCHPSILYLLNLYITKAARPIRTTDTSMMTAVPLWPLSLLSTRGALKQKDGENEHICRPRLYSNSVKYQSAQYKQREHGKQIQQHDKIHKLYFPDFCLIFNKHLKGWKLARSHVDLIFSLKLEEPHLGWPRHDPRNGVWNTSLTKMDQTACHLFR